LETRWKKSPFFNMCLLHSNKISMGQNVSERDFPVNPLFWLKRPFRFLQWFLANPIISLEKPDTIDSYCGI
jgi:hypothetical protein